MAKIPFLFGQDTIAGGKHRKGGAIYRIEQESATAFATRGRGREPTAAEIERLGITEDPAEDAGTHVRDMGKPAPAPAPAPKAVASPAAAPKTDQAG